MGDREAQRNELEILESIYGDLIWFEAEDKIRVAFDNDNVRLSVKLPENYPTLEPAQYELSCPSLSREERYALEDELNNACLENLGMPIIFTWIGVIKAFLEAKSEPVLDTSTSTEESEPAVDHFATEIVENIVPTIYHGDVFTDRKSHFQAHLARVHSKDEVELVLNRLLENPKISRATHNMYAYRFTEIRSGREIKVHDCFDDGETGASSKMLELLEKMDASNVLVVVSRWYGGIHLGPDRFRHINNLTREIVTVHGLDSRSSSK